MRHISILLLGAFAAASLTAQAQEPLPTPATIMGIPETHDDGNRTIDPVMLASAGARAMLATQRDAHGRDEIWSGEVAGSGILGARPWMVGAAAFPTACCANAPVALMHGVIVSNRREANGIDRGNDLYSATWDGSRLVSEKRIDALNSDYWDDQPAFSADGSLLVFASNRARPESGALDLYVARRGADGAWDAPRLISEICSPAAHEITPWVGPDGWLYYATDESGTYDIWRAPIDRVGIVNASRRESVTGVNTVEANEFRPSFSSCHGYFLYVSGVAGRPLRQLHVESTLPSDWIKITVYRPGADGVVPTCDFPVDVTELGVEGSPKTPACDGAVIRYPLRSTGGALNEQCTRRFRVRAIVPQGSDLISPEDTLTVSMCGVCDRSYSLILRPRRVDNEPIRFAVRSVPFFVKGYWCPTTKLYSDFIRCQTVFLDPVCRVQPDSDPPDKVKDCLAEYGAPHDLTEVRWHAPSVDETPRDGLCVSRAEIRDSVETWSGTVDAEINRMIEDMRSALRHPLVRRASAEKRMITVTVRGWTDPDRIESMCQYTGATVRFTDGIGGIGLVNRGSGNWISKDGVVRENTPFRLSPPDGNFMLSALRAYYMAVLLDSAWRRSISEYDSERAAGHIRVMADGGAINPRRLAEEQMRSVEVIVTADHSDAAPAPDVIPTASIDLTCRKCE